MRMRAPTFDGANAVATEIVVEELAIALHGRRHEYELEIGTFVERLTENDE